MRTRGQSWLALWIHFIDTPSVEAPQRYRASPPCPVSETTCKCYLPSFVQRRVQHRRLPPVNRTWSLVADDSADERAHMVWFAFVMEEGFEGVRYREMVRGIDGCRGLTSGVSG